MRPSDPRAASPENIARAREAEKILEYRSAGLTLRQIADRTGLGINTVSKRIKRAIAATNREAAKDYVALELERLDRLQSAAWSIVDDEEKPDGTRLKAAETVLRIMERRSKLLGLDHAEMRELEQSRNRLAAEQGAVVAGALERIFNALALTPEQRALLPTVVPAEFANPGPMVLEGETVDDDEDEP